MHVSVRLFMCVCVCMFMCYELMSSYEGEFMCMNMLLIHTQLRKLVYTGNVLTTASKLIEFQNVYIGIYTRYLFIQNGSIVVDFMLRPTGVRRLHNVLVPLDI